MTKTIQAVPFKTLREQRQLAEMALTHHKTKIAKAQIKVIVLKRELIEFRQLLTKARQNEKDGLKNNVKKTTSKK